MLVRQLFVYIHGGSMFTVYNFQRYFVKTRVLKDAASEGPHPLMHARRHLTQRTVATFLIMKVVAVDCNVVSALSVVMGMSCSWALTNINI